MKLSGAAKRKLNELINRADFVSIIDIEYDGLTIIVWINFKDDIARIDSFGKVNWL